MLEDLGFEKFSFARGFAAQISSEQSESSTSIKGVSSFRSLVKPRQRYKAAIFVLKVANVDAANFLGKQFKYAITAEFSRRDHA